MVTTRLTVPQQLAQMDRDRLRGYREHLDFYNGLQWPSSRRRERRLTFNYVRAFIDKLASYLTQGMVVTAEPWDASPESRERAQRARAALDAVADANALTQLDYETEVDASILGDGCYKVTWDPEGETVRISAPDVQGVFAWWVGDDFSRTWRVASRYRLTAEEAEGLYGVTPQGSEVVVVEVWTEQTFSLPSLREQTFSGWTTCCWRNGRTPTGRYPSSSSRTFGSRRSSGGSPTSLRSWSRSGS